MKKRCILLLAVLLLILAACSSGIEKCSKYKTLESKNACVSKIALEEKDINLCRYGSKNCYGVMWLESPQIETCSKIEDLGTKEICYGQIASIKNDKSIFYTALNATLVIPNCLFIDLNR